MAMLVLEYVNKFFKDFHAVCDLSFEVQQGEFVSLLGPSGCGKTTTLRMIAGLEEVSSGAIYLGGKDVTTTSPFKRNTGMVFQSYALFPHMSVEDNISFGLIMRNFDKQKIPNQIKNSLELIHLEGHEKRMPHELSGGQQQRIALARALAIEPEILLLDEPLSNLDAKLREDMRIEIKKIQKEIGVTTVYVTHDQEEALTLSDRILVMCKGEILESGRPMEIYSNPQSEFAALFIGHSNSLFGSVIGDEEGFIKIKSDKGLPFSSTPQPNIQKNDKVLVLIRQERMRIHRPGDKECKPTANCIPAEVELMTFQGSVIEYICNARGHEFKIRRPNEGNILIVSSGEKINVEWDPEDCIIIKK